MPENDIPMDEAARIGTTLEFPMDATFFDRTDFAQWDILEGLQRCFLDPAQHPEAVEFLRALHLAFMGMHPHFRLVLERAPEGAAFAPYTKVKRHLLATDLTQRIDIAVARGAKLEAEVQAACDETGLSRREVFRFLRETRERRLQWRLMAEMDGYECPWPVPDDLMIDDSGRLVPNAG